MISLFSVSSVPRETREIVATASQLFLKTVQTVHEAEENEASRRRLLDWVNSLTASNCSFVDYGLGKLLEILLKASGEVILARGARRVRRSPEKPIYIDAVAELFGSLSDKVTDVALAAWKNKALATKLRTWVLARTDPRCSWAENYVMTLLEKELDIWCP